MNERMVDVQVIDYTLAREEQPPAVIQILTDPRLIFGGKGGPGCISREPDKQGL